MELYILEGIYDAISEGRSYLDVLTPKESDIATSFIIKNYALPNEDFDITMRRLGAVCYSVDRELFLCASEIELKEELSNMSDMSLLDRLKEVYSIASDELYPNRKSYFVNRLLINVATLNTGKIYRDITDEYVSGLSEEEADLTTSAVQITSSKRIECLISFEKFILSGISEDMSILSTSEDNIINSDMIDLLVDVEDCNEFILRFDTKSCKLHTFLCDEEIHYYILGEFYTRYLANMKKCYNNYGYIGEIPKAILLKGIDYQEVYEYLSSSDNFGDLLDFTGNQDVCTILQPKCLVFVMKGTAVLKKPFGVIFDCKNTSVISHSKEYLLPIMFKADDINKLGVTFEDDKTVMPFPSKPGVYVINPVLIKNLLSNKSRVLKNIQISNFSLNDIKDYAIPRSIVNMENSVYLKNVFGG